MSLFTALIEQISFQKQHNKKGTQNGKIWSRNNSLSL
jgi:hypothetical protein